MTVATDIQRAIGVRQRLYLQIDGVQEKLWQDDGSGSPPSWDSTGKVCLLPPTEISIGLDVTKMRAESSAQTFQFIDVKDTDGLSWWGKKLGSSAWDAANHWRVNVGSAPQTYVDCNAVNIPIKDNTNFPAAGGTFYIGREALNADNAALNVIQGVSKGIYSAFHSSNRGESTYGYSYLRPEPVSGHYHMTIGEAPFSFHGRRVGLYMTTYDTATSEWNSDATAVEVTDDDFEDDVRGVIWTDTAGNGTIAESGGVLDVKAESGVECYWAGNAPFASIKMSDIRTRADALFCAETKCTLTFEGGIGSVGFGGCGTGVVLWEDVNNAWGVWFRADGDVARNRVLAASWDTGAYAGNVVTTKWFRVYWNTATDVTSIPIDGSLLESGETRMYWSIDGSEWTAFEAAAALTNDADEIRLYATNWASAEKWCNGSFEYLTVTQTAPAGSTELIWAGKVSNTIQHKPNPSKEEGHWKMSCESILADIDDDICTNLYAPDLKGINLTGHAAGREMWAEYIPKTATSAIDNDSFVFDPAHYKDAAAVVANFAATPDAIKFTAPSGQSFAVYLVYNVWKNRYVFGAISTVGKGRVEIYTSRYNKPNDRCHPLLALGFTARKYTLPLVPLSAGTLWGGNVLADEAPAIAYQPCQSIHNGSKLYVDDAEGFWADQGDDASAAGYIRIDDKHTVTKSNRNGIQYFARYSARSGDELTLSWPTSIAAGYLQDDHVVSRAEDEPVPVEQIYWPVYQRTDGTRRGIFENHLLTLASTGTQRYNGEYDLLAKDLGLGIQEDLIDAQSFLDADKAISSNPLTDRSAYHMFEPISWLDLLTRDSALFGYAVTWRRGKLHLSDVIYPNKAGATITLDDSTRAVRAEKLLTDTSISTVVNQFEFKIDVRKRMREITISDADSVAMLGANSVEIEHPGIRDGQYVIAALTNEVIGRPFRFPSPMVECTLAPQYLNRVYPGDLVVLSSGDIPDPDGSGTFDTTKYALVLDASWNHKTKVGSAKLLLLTHTEDYGNPWAPAALVTAYAASVITLAANEYGDSAKDPADGTAFSSGDEVNIIERAPADPSSPQIWRRTLSDDYGDAGAGQFTLSSALAGFDATKEYVMTFADYGTIAAAQKLRGVHQADTASELLDGSAKANRYG